MSENANFESISIKSTPNGKTYLIKLTMATVILSGLKHLNTNNFLNGYYSNLLKSNGNFWSSGVRSLYQSLNLLGASFSIF